LLRPSDYGVTLGEAVWLGLREHILADPSHLLLTGEY